MKLSQWTDGLLLGAERVARQIYWSFPRLRSLARRCGPPPKPQVAAREELKQYLREIGVTPGSLVMAHTAVSSLRLTAGDRPPPPAGFLATAQKLVDDLRELVGETGTLVMPTHPRYQSENDYAPPSESAGPIVYDPRRTPCGVGLANELFWRRKGVLRSLHPLNTLAAAGPLAAELFEGNLNSQKPLPHGIFSGYYRFCQHNGLVVSIGTPLRRCLTILHVAEDVRDAQWPIRDFFEERRYIVRVDGRDQSVVVREPGLYYTMFCICWYSATRCLLREGILHEGRVGSVRVDWARAREVFEYCMSRSANSAFPYYAPWFFRKKG